IPQRSCRRTLPPVKFVGSRVRSPTRRRCWPAPHPQTVEDREVLRKRRRNNSLPPFGHEFVSIEALSGLVLLSGAVAALVWANASDASYHDIWQHHLDVGFDLTLQKWVNDGLMTVFFFVVGLEIKREVVRGELRD